jgi:hypothetical protein
MLMMYSDPRNVFAHFSTNITDTEFRDARDGLYVFLLSTAGAMNRCIFIVSVEFLTTRTGFLR